MNDYIASQLLIILLFDVDRRGRRETIQKCVNTSMNEEPKISICSRLFIQQPVCPFTIWKIIPQDLGLHTFI